MNLVHPGITDCAVLEHDDELLQEMVCVARGANRRFNLVLPSITGRPQQLACQSITTRQSRRIAVRGGCFSGHYGVQDAYYSASTRRSTSNRLPRARGFGSGYARRGFRSFADPRRVQKHYKMAMRPTWLGAVGMDSIWAADIPPINQKWRSAVRRASSKSGQLNQRFPEV